MGEEFNVCKICVMQKGLKGSDLSKGKCDYAFKTEEELIDHIKEVHNMEIQRKTIVHCHSCSSLLVYEYKPGEIVKCTVCEEPNKIVSYGEAMEILIKYGGLELVDTTK